MLLRLLIVLSAEGLVLSNYSLSTEWNFANYCQQRDMVPIQITFPLLVLKALKFLDISFCMSVNIILVLSYTTRTAKRVS